MRPAWPWNSPALPEAEILTHLVRLNHERAREKANGHVRYLRPAYQAPDTERTKLSLPAAAAFSDAGRSAFPTEGIAPQAWPAELAQQMQALRDALQQAVQPLTVAQVAAGFRRVRADKIEPLLHSWWSCLYSVRRLRAPTRFNFSP